MSARIRVDERDQLVNAIVKHQFTAKVDAAKTERNKYGDAFYNEYFGKNAALMQSLPEGFLPVKDTLRSNKNQEVCFSEHKRVPNSVEQRWREETDFKKFKSFATYEKADKVVADFLAEKNRLEARIRGVIASAGSWKRLYAIWPEATEIIKKFDTSDESNLPAVIPQELNKKLGLPPDTAKAA